MKTRINLNRLTRRDFLKTILAGSAMFAVTGASKVGLNGDSKAFAAQINEPEHQAAEHGSHSGSMGTVGDVDPASSGIDTQAFLSDFDYGTVSQLEDGQTLREYQIVAVDREIEIAPGVFFPAWTYNGRVPGPTIRCVDGDRIRINFVNAGSHPHTIHFHGIHSATMDGVPNIGAGSIGPGESTVYEFDAAPFGCHLYHCHAIPLKRHVHKGLYGAFIVDPDPDKYEGDQRKAAKTRNHNYPENQGVNEMVMVMNAFDTNFDGDNEVYAVNTVAFAYMNQPIKIRHDQLQRIYLINITEFDPINSLHIHANFFDYYDHGTSLEPTSKTIDTVMQCQAQRGIVEFSYENFEPNLYMFHAHQSEFAELGWMAFFEVEA